MEHPSSFIVVQPGLEPAAEKELRFWWSELFADQECPALSVETGGLNLSCPLECISTLHHYLKVPTRILLRVGDFKARDFTTLFRELKKQPWNKWVGAADCIFHVSSTRSRLAISKRIKMTAEDALEAYRAQQQPPKDGQGQEVEVYLRVSEDRVQISLNLSGVALYKRSQKEMSARAPLRETMAAGLIWHMHTGESELRIADPLCGTGTFLVESLSLYQRIESRSFTWQDMRLFKSVPLLKKHYCQIPFCAQALGWDQHEGVVQTAKKNLTGVATDEQKVFVQARDFTNSENTEKVEVDWVLGNLPYGERIKPAEGVEKFYQSFLPALQRSFSYQKCGILVAREHRKHLETKGHKKLEELELKNGGIPVSFIVFKKNQ